MTPNGVALRAEPRMHVLLKRRNDTVGTDRSPLNVSVKVLSDAGFQMHPGLHLYWDNDNCLSLLHGVDNHLYARWRNQGIDGARDYYHVIPDSKKNGSWLRIVMTSRNVFLFCSREGLNWQSLGDLGFRPREGVAPGKIVLGRGWLGEPKNKDAHLELANDYYPDNAKNLITSTFSRFLLRDSPEPVPEGIQLDAKESWEQTLEAIDVATAPKKWQILGPRPDRDYRVFKTTLEPDATDEWSPMPKHDGGKPFRETQWTRPEDDNGCFVDLSEILEIGSMTVAFARTEVDWPVAGPGCLWFDCNGKAVVYLNNRRVYADEGRDYWQPPASKDRIRIPVQMKAGKNIIKIKSGLAGGLRGPWGFYLRVERADPGYRIRLLERLMELFPAEAKDWRGAQAVMEIARRYLQLLNFEGASAAWDKARAAFEKNDEYRVEALEGKLGLLESLRDYGAFAAAGEQYLAQYPRGAGSNSAFRACVLGEYLSGKADAAEARVNKWVEQAGQDGLRARWGLRVLASAAAAAGQSARRFTALERLAAHPSIDTMERARAAFEAAFARAHLELQAVQSGGKLDTNNLTQACNAAQKGVALLPGSANPLVKAWATEAENDLRAGKHERALAGYWGASLLALGASDPEAAPFLALTRPYTLPPVGWDAKAGKLRELNDPLKQESWNVLAETLHEVKWLETWRAIGPFDNTEGIGEQTDYGPETNLDFKAGHAGRGGHKSWVAVDPKAWHDLGQDLKPALGDCRGGVVYIAREFEVTEAKELYLWLSMRAGWFAWIDKQPVGSRTEEWYRLDGTRIPVKLTPGKHCLLLKLVAPGDDPFTFRVRLSAEPELGLNLLRLAWLAREFHPIQYLYSFMYDLRWLMEFSNGKAAGPVIAAIGNACATLYPSQGDNRWHCSYWPFDRLMEQGLTSEAADGYRDLLQRVDSSADYPERAGQAWYATWQLFNALMNQGDTAAADAALRMFVARYPDAYAAAGQALVFRAALRHDFGLSQASRPYYERVLREYANASDYYRFAPGGIVFARQYVPEKLYFETAGEAQSIVEAATRQMKTGEAQDVERAMRNLSDVLRTSSGSLICVNDSRFAPLYVGVREYFRALLEALSKDLRAVYLKTVAGPSEERYRAAAEQNDVAALEALACEFHFTPAAAHALNHAGNLYLDNGSYAQAAAAFKYLLQSCKDSDGIAPSLVLAKLARALLLDRQVAGAKAAADQLKKDFAAEELKIGGRMVNAGQYASALIEQLGKVGPQAQGTGEGTTLTFGGNLQRTGLAMEGKPPTPGAVMWVRPQIQSANMDYARSRFWPDPFAHLQPFPVVSEDKAFVGSLEALQALDLNTGRVLWRQAWGSSGSLVPRQFTGFPISCPTLSDGKLYLRVMSGRKSALQCWNADNGQLRWTTEGVPELKRATWISDPLVAYGLAVAVFVEAGDANVHGVAAVDAATGNFRWRALLATGNTGIRIGQEYYASSMQLGPPAADRGTIYTATGLGSAVALNAFTGEVVWLSGYTRMHMNDINYGNTSIAGNARIRALKILSRGPASPVLTEDLVILAPKDAPGLLAFNRENGLIRWQHDLQDCRYVAGLCDGRVLAADNEVHAIDAATGEIAWRYSLQGSRLYGHPGYASGVLYLPTEDNLQLLDARSGRLQSVHAWDARIGPLANFAFSGKTLVGVNETLVAAIGTGGTPAALPLQEAQTAAAAGNLDLAAQRYSQVARSGEMDDVLPAVSGWVKTLEKLGQKETAVAEVDQLLADKPALLESASSFWKVSKSCFAESLKERLGQAPPAVAPVKTNLAGTLAYAWQLPGENARVYFPPDGPQDRFLAWVGNHLCCLRLSAKFELLWQIYVGPGASELKIGPSLIAVAGYPNLLLIDRDTGELLWKLDLPTDRKKQRLRANPYGSGFAKVAVCENYVAFIAGDGLFVYDVKTRKERWANERRDRRALYLGFVGNRLVEVTGQGGQDTYYVAYDAATGNRLDNKPFARKTDWTNTAVSPDGELLIYKPNAQTLAGIDLKNGKQLWDTQVQHLDAGYAPWVGLRFIGDCLTYSGDARDGERGWHTYWITPRTGKIIRKTAGGAQIGNSFVFIRDHWGRQVVRYDVDKGNLREVWQRVLKDHECIYHHAIDLFMFENRLYVVYARNMDGGADQYVLRIFDWESGNVLHNEVLPGRPIRADNGVAFRDVIYPQGDLLIYGAQEGLFAFTPLGQSRAEACAQLRKTAADTAAPAAGRRDARRAWMALEAPTTQAFLAPPEAKIDGDLSDWALTEPLTVEGQDYFTPLADEGAWRGPQDLSFKLYSAWKSAGLFLAIDVADDKFVPPPAGAPINSGDSISVALNSTSDPGAGFHSAENLLCSVALVDGRTVFSVQPEPSDDEEARVVTRAVPASDGRGARYELLIPWPLLRKDPRLRPGDRREMRLGVAAFDDDGQGVKGAIEWGAAVTSPTLAPIRLGHLSLVDISLEKIERYRKVIARIPDTGEAMNYLDLILLSKRGRKADQERVAELEGFVKANPSSRNVSRVLNLLANSYRKLGEADPNAKVVELAKRAKCPPAIIDNISGKVLRVWVLPNDKNPPKMIMVQFLVRGWGWVRRAYWGAPSVDWGRDGTPERLCLGPLPKPGEWTALDIRPVDFDIEDADIQGLAFSTFGGLTHFDSISVIVEGKETMLLEDALPKNIRVEGNAFNCVDNPRRSGARSFTGGATGGVMNPALVTTDGSVWFSFKSPSAPKPADPDPQKMADIYRVVAGLVPDTPEGLVFLRRLLDWLPRKDVLPLSIVECENYLKQHPDTQNALSILQMLRAFYTQSGELSPGARCEALMQAFKLPRDACRAFYSQFAPTWLENWVVIGPFGAVGDRRGQEQSLQPERNLDLAWKTAGPGEVQLTWNKISAAKDEKGKPNTTGFVNLLPFLAEKMDRELRNNVSRSPYFAYAYLKVSVPTKRRALLLFGVNDIMSVWLNGRRVVEQAEPGNAKDAAAVQVTLKIGENELLLKPGVRHGNLGFYFRIADENGRPFNDLTFPEVRIPENK